MPEQIITIETPAGFNFKRTVYSHGWYSLPPFELDKENWILTRVFDLENAAPVAARVRESDNGLACEIASAVAEKEAEKIAKDFRHILQLDEDFSEFYELMKGEEDFVWIAQTNAGRLLRSPTVFEDLVKSLATTNCSWALTKKMVTNLVEKLGEPTADGSRKSFPSPAAMAAQSVDFYKNEIRAGYRAAFFAELAERVAGGALAVEDWLTGDLPTKELKKTIKSVKGVGDYAAENLLKLLGRYDGLALDSYLRMRFAQKHNNGAACADKQIYDYYEKFGEWRGLAIWCDMTRDWM